MNTFPWPIFFIFLAAGLLGTAAVLPYALSMNPKAAEALKGAGQAQPGAKKMPPAPVLVLISLLQGSLLVALASFVGLLAAREVGLGAPILEAALAGRPVGGLILEMMPAALLLGLACGVALMALEGGFFMTRIPRALAGMDARTALWKRVLACFYGGIVEEILLRLFVMSGLVWLIGLVWQDSSGAPALGAFWAANILATLAFGAGHLPATAQLVKLTPMVVFRGLLLNGIPGIALGYLYMRYGLESAMLAHFSMDILIHLVMPPLMRKRAEAVFGKTAGQAV